MRHPTLDPDDAMRPAKMRHLFLLGALLLGAGGCQALEAPNFNAGDLGELQTDPTRASVGAAVTGLTIVTRDVYAGDDNDLVAMLGVLGRENYVLDPADPRFVTEMLAGSLSPSSPALGGNYWERPYQNVRMVDVILNALPALEAGEMTEAEKAATRGFVKTWKALDLLVIAETRDSNCDGDLGCPSAVEEDPEDLAPALPLEELYAAIEELLDSGLADLESAGDRFPFELHSGFSGFATPAAFRQFNRALAARVDVYVGTIFDRPAKFQEALDDLAASFMDPGGDFRTGVYHVYGTGSGDISNGLFQPSSDPIYRAHRSVRENARLQAGGDTLDRRFLEKTRPVQARFIDQGQQVGSDLGFEIYTSPSTPVPVIRNEELLLLAAEAHINMGELEEAEPFLNEVRTRAGGLPSVDLSSMSQAEAITELLYDRMYSLLAEGGHRWIDMRRYGRLEQLPLDLPSHQVNARYPVPIDEQLARGG